MRLERHLGFVVGLMRDYFLLSLPAKVAIVEHSKHSKPVAPEFPDNQQIGKRRDIEPKFGGILLERARLTVRKIAENLCHGLEKREAVLGGEVDSALKRCNGVQKHERLVAASKGFGDELLTVAIRVEKADRPRPRHPAIGNQPGKGFPRADFPRPGHRWKARFERRRRDHATQAADRLVERFLDRRIEDQTAQTRSLAITYRRAVA